MSDGPETCDCKVCKAITASQGKDRAHVRAVFRRLDRPTQSVLGAVYRVTTKTARPGDVERLAKASAACSRKGTHWSTADLRA